MKTISKSNFFFHEFIRKSKIELFSTRQNIKSHQTLIRILKGQNKEKLSIFNIKVWSHGRYTPYTTTGGKKGGFLSF